MALVALCIVKRFNPAWAAVEIHQAAASLSLSAERASRIATRAVALFEPVVDRLLRRGRPPRDHQPQELHRELALTRALLATATSLLSQMRLRRNKTLRALLVGAWLRLHAEHAITQAAFCQAMALPQRTLRDWLKRPAAPERPAPPATGKPPKRSRPPRRGRFGFDVTLPATQIAGDTTDIQAFGVPLKLTAAQDIGGRDAALLESFVIEPEDNAEHVIEVMTAALVDLPGAQAITDQGTPYMAQATRDALEALRAEHAPQREGHPQGKATLERAFGVIKSIAAPILELTNQAAAKVPRLCNNIIAIYATRLLITSLLRAYQSGARMAREALQQRGGASLQELQQRAEQSRQAAVARETSARQLLAHIHDLYGMAGSAHSFIQRLRGYPIDVLREAEKQFRAQVHRDDIRDRASYFGAIVRSCHDQFLKDRRRTLREQAELRQSQAQSDDFEDRLRRWRAVPDHWLRIALDFLAVQWRDGRLVCDGHGVGLGYLRASLHALFAMYDPGTAASLAAGVWSAFQLQAAPSLRAAGVLTIHELFEAELRRATLADPPCHHPDAAGILDSLGRNARPPPSVRLPN